MPDRILLQIYSAILSNIADLEMLAFRRALRCSYGRHSLRATSVCADCHISLRRRETCKLRLRRQLQRPLLLVGIVTGRV